MIVVAQPCPKSIHWSTQARSFWDPHSQSRIIAATPSSRPDLWSQFIDGAAASYHRYGVSSALEFDKIKNGHTTSAFFAAVDHDGRMLAGMRAQGPYSAAGQSHANIEWKGHDVGRAQIHSMVAQRIPEGVVELKSAWVAESAPRSKDLVMTIGHSPLFAMALLRARYALATSAAHVLKAWTKTGAVVATHIDAIPYPDNRYLTNVIWWDHETVPQVADSDQYHRIRYGTECLMNPIGAYEAIAS